MSSSSSSSGTASPSPPPAPSKHKRISPPRSAEKSGASGGSSKKEKTAEDKDKKEKTASSSKSTSDGGKLQPPPKPPTALIEKTAAFEDEETRLRRKLLQKKLAAEGGKDSVSSAPPAKLTKREVVMVDDAIEEGLHIRPPQAALLRSESASSTGRKREDSSSKSHKERHSRHKHEHSRSRHGDRSTSGSRNAESASGGSRTVTAGVSGVSLGDLRQKIDRAQEGWARWKKNLDGADAPPPRSGTDGATSGHRKRSPKPDRDHRSRSNRGVGGGSRGGDQKSSRDPPSAGGAATGVNAEKSATQRHRHRKNSDSRSGGSSKRNRSADKEQREKSKDRGAAEKSGREKSEKNRDKLADSTKEAGEKRNSEGEEEKLPEPRLVVSQSQPILDHGTTTIVSDHESYEGESDPGPDGVRKVSKKHHAHPNLQDIDSPDHGKESGEATDSDEDDRPRPSKARSAAVRQQQQQQPSKYSKFQSSDSDASESDYGGGRGGGADRSDGSNDDDDYSSGNDTPQDESNELDDLPSEEEAVDPHAHLPVFYPGISGCRSVDEFHCLNRIEEGTYGVVYRAKEKRTDEVVALKRLKMEKEKEGFPITSLREINMLLKAGNHDNVVNVREIVVGSNMDRIYLVMDYVEHDMKSLMESMKAPFLVGEVKTLLKQLLSGVHHMHDNWILHRDLKTSNLLLSHRGILKIGDFGLAREYGSPLKPYTPIVVTLWYRAPELLLGCKQYSTPIDVWSVGCILAEFLTLKPLFPGRGEADEINRHFKMLGTPNADIWPEYPEFPAVKKMTFVNQPYNHLRKQFGHTLSDVGFKLLNKLLTYNPDRRITALQALKDDWFNEDPRPVHPDMFPTWPAKSEQGKPPPKNAEPKPPSGGKQYEDESSMQGVDTNLLESLQVKPSDMGSAGFALRFDLPKF